MAKNSVELKNWNKLPKEVFSADGDSVHIMPDMVMEVDRKFLWNLPKNVMEHKENFTVFGKKKTKEVDITSETGNSQGTETERKTLNTGNVPISKVEAS